jgi:hypothetical protein
MNKIQRKRLLKLATHLASDAPLKVGDFCFEYLYRPNICGCAIGESCFLFRGWKLGEFDSPVLSKGNLNSQESANEFFGLTMEESNHLFYPNRQIPELYGGVMLIHSATRYQVAENIFAFLKKKESGDEL